MINIAPFAKIIFSSLSDFSTDNDAHYVLRRKLRTSWQDFSFHTALEDNPYIILKFEKIFEVHKIIITNRNVCKDRANSLTVEGYYENKISFIWNNITEKFETIEIDFDSPKIIDCLKFSLKERNYFHLKYIEVFTKIEFLNTIVECPYLIPIVNRIKTLLGERYRCLLDNTNDLIFYDNLCNNYALYKIQILERELLLCISVDLNLFPILGNYYHFFIELTRRNNVTIEFSNNSLLIKLFFINNNNYINIDLSKFHESIFKIINPFLYCFRNSSSQIVHSNDNFVIIDTDSCSCWGFADRLRGALFLLDILKDTNLRTYIKFTKPFNLNKYYIFKDASNSLTNISSPNVSFGAVSCGIPYIENISNIQGIFRSILLNANNFKCVSLGTNILNMPSLGIFEKYFTRTNYLNNEIKKYKKIIGENYISVSYRFRGILGDFNEPLTTVLSSDEQYVVLHKSKQALKQFIKDNSINQSILVLSDSPIFLNFIRDIPSVYVFPDNIQHMVCMDDNLASEMSFLKTLVDFNLIMDADDTYLFLSEFLYKSGFPRVAAQCAGKDCKYYWF